MFKVSKNANGIAPANNTFINCGSIQGTLAAGASDFQLDAHTSQTAIISPRASSHTLRIDCGNSAAVDLAGLPPSVTLLNASDSAAPQFLGGTQASYQAAGVQADHSARTVTEASFAWQAECEIVVNAVGSAGGYTDIGSVRMFPTGAPVKCRPGRGVPRR